MQQRAKEHQSDVERRLWNLKDAGRALGGVSVSTLRAHIRLGHIRPIRLGATLYIDGGTLERIIAKGLPRLVLRPNQAKVNGGSES